MGTSTPSMGDALRPIIVDIVKETVPGEVNKALAEAVTAAGSGAKSKAPAPAAAVATTIVIASKGELASEPHPFLGALVLVRSGDSGVHFGRLAYVSTAANGSCAVHLVDSRRLWSWKGLKGVALSGVARHGIDKKNSKVDEVVEAVVCSVIELLKCTEEAAKTIIEA